MKKTLSVTVYNEAGVLTRIATVFSSRGFNLESITVGATERPGVSRIILVLPGDQQTIEQIIKQLKKLVQIIDVKDLSLEPIVERELMLIRVSVTNTTRAQIMEITKIFRAKIVDVSERALTLEVTGDPGKMATIEELLEPYSVIQIVRTGKIAIKRHDEIRNRAVEYF